MVGFSTKTLILGNKDLLNYCKSCGISTEKLRQCNIEKMGDSFVIVMPKEGSELVESTMENDIATQPDIVLIMRVEESGDIEFRTTDSTIRLLEV